MDKKNKKHELYDEEEQVKDAAGEEEEIEEVSEDEESSEIAELTAQLEESENKYRRALADYQNLQKRAAEERTSWARLANRDLLLRILTVLDTLVLAQKHIDDQGLNVSINLFRDVLKAESVIQIETIGKEFDPHLMEAVAADEGKENIVLEELRAGFTIHDTLLRPAQVKVGREMKD
jgi:molecular chaperone GrpE